jgi:hypothetical protein
VALVHSAFASRGGIRRSLVGSLGGGREGSGVVLVEMQKGMRMLPGYRPLWVLIDDRLLEAME